MAESNGIHWTSDEDLLERFVAGRVPATERRTLEAHLASCERCRERVDDERLMSAGVRAEGRVELRRELHDRLQRRRAPDASGVWRWMAAAAMLVAAVGVWRWLAPVELPQVTEERSKSGIAEPRKSAEIPAAAETEPRRFRDEDRRMARRETGESTSIAPPPAAGIALEDERSRVVADALKPSPQPALAEAALETNTEPGEIWVLASAIETERTVDRQERAEDVDAMKLRTAAAPAGKGETAPRQQFPSGPFPVQVRQSPQEALPSWQRANFLQAGPRQVPARLTRVRDSLMIELFPPTLYTTDQFARIIVRWPASDSVVVAVGPQMLGLRIPPSLQAR